MQVKNRNFAYFVLGYFFFSLQFVSSFYDLSSALIISSHIITESSIKLAKHLPFSQPHVAGFQI